MHWITGFIKQIYFLYINITCNLSITDLQGLLKQAGKRDREFVITDACG